MNKRNDQYGGNKINRLRIVKNIIAKLNQKSKSITKIWGQGFQQMTLLKVDWI